MKSVIALIVITIVASTLAVSVDRVKKSKTQVRAKAKSEGSGDWNSGYVIPGILVVKPTESFDTNKMLAKGAKFQAKTLETPSSDEEKLGWGFEMGAPADNLSKIMVKGSKGYYIPFRYFTSKCEYSNPFNDYKSFTFWMQNDSKESFKLRILLPYKSIGWYITDEESYKICSFVDASRIKQQGNIKNGKAAVNSAATSFVTNSPLLKSAKEGAEKLKAEQEAKKKELETLKKDSEAKEKTFETNSTAINDKEIELNKLKDAQNELSKEIISLNSRIENIDQALSLSQANSSPTELVTKYEKVVQDNTKELKDAITKLKGFAPPRSAELDSAEKAVTEKSDLKELESNLTKVVPS